jgi:integrase
MKPERFKIAGCTLFKQEKSPFYNMRVMVKGKRRQFSTGESTKATAADKARAILADLKSRGLTETIALHSRRADEVPSDPTFDEFGKLYQDVVAGAEAPPSVQTRARYIKSIKQIATALRISRVRALTPEKIKQFIADYQAEGSEACRSATSVKISLNSILRNSAALFSKVALAGYADRGLKIVNPFAGLKLRRVEIRGFTPLRPEVLQTIWSSAVLLRDGDPNAKTISRKAIAKKDKTGNACRICGNPVTKKRSGPMGQLCSARCRNIARRAGEPDWRKPHPEAYLILLLELGLGLRRHESDKAEKDWFFTGPKGRIFLEVKPTPFFTPKSKERRVIPAPAALYDELKRFFREDSQFIVPGREPKQYPAGRTPKNLVYRCDVHHRALAKWLRLHGIKDPKPCHVLRKQFGSYVATSFSLYHAQKLLGHSSPQVTSDYYASLVELPETNNIQLEPVKTASGGLIEQV